GFDLYLGQKSAMERFGDPIQDILAGWEAHVGFGLANPLFYTLMYDKVRPGHSPAAQPRPAELLRVVTEPAAEHDRLAVPQEQAAAHILATNIGVTLRQVILAAPDPALSRAVREGVIAAITGMGSQPRTPLSAAVELAAAHPEVLGRAETQLLIEWLGRLNKDAL